MNAEGHWQCFDTGVADYVCVCEDGWGGASCDRLASCDLGFGNANALNCICHGLNNVADVVAGKTQASGYLCVHLGVRAL